LGLLLCFLTLCYATRTDALAAVLIAVKIQNSDHRMLVCDLKR
jgi:hypothetical protein